MPPSRRGGSRAIRQRARQQARRAGERRRQERVEQEKRIRGQVEVVLTALGVRDAAISRQEQIAGAVLVRMTREEGLTLGQVVQWCGGLLEARELARLRRATLDAEPEEPAEPAEPDPADEADERQLASRPELRAESPRNGASLPAGERDDGTRGESRS